MYIGARLALFFLWLLHWLPLSVLAFIGTSLGKLLYRFAHTRRKIAKRNIELCFPEKTPVDQEAIVKEHFQLLTRSVLERGLIFYASTERLKKLIHVEGDPHFGDKHPDQNFTIFIPHFVGLDISAIALSLFQERTGVSIYQEQSNPVMNKAVNNARNRLGKVQLFSRQQGLVPVIKAIRKTKAMLASLPDQDFGLQDAEFIPFFGVSAATLTSTSRIANAHNMKIIPVVTEILPGGQGYRTQFFPPMQSIPSNDAYNDTLKMNQFIEKQIRLFPAQYLWVHRRFKTRPPGEASVYD